MTRYLGRYRYPFLVAFGIHLMLFLMLHLVPDNEEPPVNLVSFQMVNLARTEKPSAKSRKKVTPPKKVIKKKPVPKNSDVAEKYVKRKPEKIEKVQEITQDTPKQTDRPVTNEIVDQSDLDNENVQPFGNMRPNYPQFARDAQIEGWVTVKVLVNTRGRVEEVKTVDYAGHKSFIRETVKVAQKWRFPPLTAKGQRVKSWILQKVVFRLTD